MRPTACPPLHHDVLAQFDLQPITMEFRVMMVCLAAINFILAFFSEVSLGRPLVIVIVIGRHRCNCLQSLLSWTTLSSFA